MSKIKVMLGFDMETDIGSWTPWYDGLVNGTSVILDILKKHEISATFYFTGDSCKKHPEVTHSVKDAGHEIGCHTLFHETIGEALFEIPGMVPVLSHEVEPRIRLATEWVEEVAGVRPVSFRCPRLFGSTTVANALENLGYLTDATYPMYYFRKQLVPYHPSSDDWTETGDMKLLELPNFADLSMDSQDEYGRDMDQWPLFRTESADKVMEHISGYVSYCEKQGVEPFLCFYFHPWEFWPMPEGLLHYGEGAVLPDPFLIKNCGEYGAQQFEILVEKLKGIGAEFYQAKELV
ncbi:MAG: polysaccharide deacetylase family protein [Victivallaceae bacterium]|nr:polysaccharide deacetylase family protein [Victivallaceae bacterium]